MSWEGCVGNQGGYHWNEGRRGSNGKICGSYYKGGGGKEEKNQKSWQKGMTTIKPLKRQIIKASTARRKEICSSLASNSSTTQSRLAPPLSRRTVTFDLRYSMMMMMINYDRNLNSLARMRYVGTSKVLLFKVDYSA